jgi:homoserine dehydrogenase
VIADLVDVARLADAAPAQRVAPLGFRPEALTPLRVLPIGEAFTGHALRIPVQATASALDEVLQGLAARGIAVERHGELVGADGRCELAVLTREAREADLQQALAVLGAAGGVRAPIRHLRVEALAG